MRTTLTIDDDVLARARQLASSSGTSVGKVISDLARQSLMASAPGPVRNGIRLLPPRESGRPGTLDEVNELRDDLE